jgi:hypothetical protein
VTNIGGSSGIGDISCPRASLCVAGEGNTNVVTSTNPTGGASAWTATTLAISSTLKGMSCPSATLCVGVEHGNVVTSTNPTGGASAWTVTNVDGSNNFFSGSLSCPTIHLCVAVDGAGNVVTSTNPTGGAPAWTATNVSGFLAGVSCASASLCVALSGNNVVTSTNPTGGAPAWTTTGTGDPSGLDGVSCPSTTLCVATDGTGDMVTSSDPTSGAAWTLTHVSGNDFLYGVACPTTALCVAVDQNSGAVITGTEVSIGPTVTAVSPADGPIGGGAIATVSGTNLSGASDVLFGSTDVPASNAYPCPSSSAGCFTINSSSEITVSTPAAAAGTVNVTVITPLGDSPISSADRYTYSTPGAYTPVTPFRVCDTRPTSQGITANQCNDDSTGAGSGPLTSGAKRVVTVDGFGGLPGSGVTAVVVNVTAIAPTSGTFLTLYPDGGSVPATSNLNPQAGAIVANLVEVAVSTAGKIDVFNALGTINVALDIQGYVSSASTGLFTPVAPTRICDTRAPGGSAPTQCNLSGANPIIAGRPVLTFNVRTGTDGIPATGVTAIVFNLTAIDPTAGTVLTAYAGGTTRPNVSNVNLGPGQVVPNRVIVPVSASGTVSLWNAVGSVNVAVDVNGWFSNTGPPSALVLGLLPTRICDTRAGNAGDTGCRKGTVSAGHVLTINVAGVAGIPVLGRADSPVAIVANVTAVNATTGTYVTVYPGPSGASTPLASDLNVPSLAPVTNLVVVEVGADGTINLFNAVGSVNLIVDVLGYYS